MALTPEEVLEKTFTQTQFRRGYDEREVDDFLDEVVAEMRRLAQQNDEVRGQLNECREGRGLPPVGATGEQEPTEEVKQLTARNEELERLAADYQARISDLESAHSRLQGQHEDLSAKYDGLQGSYADLEGKASASPQAPAGDGADDTRLQDLDARVAEAEKEAQQRIEAARQQAEQAEKEAQERVAAAQAQQVQPGADADPAGATTGAHALAGAAAGGASAAGILELAQRLHDEHVSAGQAEHDRLVSEAQGRHDELLATGQARFDELTSTGQAQHDELIGTATAQRDEMLSTAATQRDEMLSTANAQKEEMLTEARERATGMVVEAEQKRASILDALGREKADVEGKISSLKEFESRYRSELKSYITGQLDQLERTGVDLPGKDDAGRAQASEPVAAGGGSDESATQGEEQPAT